MNDAILKRGNISTEYIDEVLVSLMMISFEKILLKQGIKWKDRKANWSRYNDESKSKNVILINVVLKKCSL